MIGSTGMFSLLHNDLLTIWEEDDGLTYNMIFIQDDKAQERARGYSDL